MVGAILAVFELLQRRRLRAPEPGECCMAGDIVSPVTLTRAPALEAKRTR